jgi:hypothetical protein
LLYVSKVLFAARIGLAKTGGAHRGENQIADVNVKVVIAGVDVAFKDTGALGTNKIHTFGSFRQGCDSANGGHLHNVWDSVAVLAHTVTVC